jgi:hypothetical protein
MTPEREKAIQDAIIDVMTRLLQPDLSEPYQSMSPVGLHQMLESIPRDEFVAALKKMDGVCFLPGEIRIPSKHFTAE